jgi:hypothetical protein
VLEDCGFFRFGREPYPTGWFIYVDPWICAAPVRWDYGPEDLTPFEAAALAGAIADEAYAYFADAAASQQGI